MSEMKFPYAPAYWHPSFAEQQAQELKLELLDDHWILIQSLQEYFARNEHSINIRELNGALEERFHAKGGIKYLFEILPGGPVAQGCKLAGLTVPPDAIDESFGTVF